MYANMNQCFIYSLKKQNNNNSSKTFLALMKVSFCFSSGWFLLFFDIPALMKHSILDKLLHSQLFGSLVSIFNGSKCQDKYLYFPISGDFILLNLFTLEKCGCVFPVNDMLYAPLLGLRILLWNYTLQGRFNLVGCFMLRKLIDLHISRADFCL